MAVSVVKKRVRVSKNKKKSWNRYSDIKDIDKFLEDKRQEERIGGSFDEKPDDELFFIQTTAEDTAGSFSKKKGKKQLKCFQALNAYSKVPPPVKPSSNGITKKRKKLLLLKLEKYSKKIKDAKKDEKKNSVAKGKESLHLKEFHDLWSEEEKEVDPEVVDLVVYRDKITKKKPPKIPCHRFQKPSLLPSVEVPHPGASYNPSLEEHQALLKEALLIEEKKVKEEKHIKRVLTDFFPKAGDTPLQEVRMLEMSQGLFEESDSDMNPEDNQDEGHFEMGNPPVRADDRKTRAKKRKQRERKQEEQQRLHKKLDKIRNDDIYRLKSIKSKLKQKEALSQQKQKARDQRKIKEMFEPRTLSSHKYEAHDLEVNLSEELSGCLRSMKAEGSVLEDRYKSLQRRNIVESRIRQKRKRKYKLKIQIKRSHRDVV